VPITAQGYRDLLVIEAHVAHAFEHQCCRATGLGSERSGTGCEEERALWAKARPLLYVSRRAPGRARR